MHPRVTHRVVAAVIERGGKYLITQRREEAVLPLLWEFPGGRVKEGETDEEALFREVEERLGVKVIVDRKITDREHSYDGYDVHLSLYAAHLPEEQEPRAVRVRDFRWVSSDEFAEYEFPPADQATMDKLLGLHRN